MALLQNIEKFEGSDDTIENIILKTGVHSVITTRSVSASYTWKEILESDFNTILKNIIDAKNKATEVTSKSQLQASIQLYTNALNKQKEILSLYPDLKNFRMNFQAQLNEMNDSYTDAANIVVEERKLYETMYKNLQVDQDMNKKVNPCKQFKL